MKKERNPEAKKSCGKIVILSESNDLRKIAGYLLENFERKNINLEFIYTKKK